MTMRLVGPGTIYCEHCRRVVWGGLKPEDNGRAYHPTAKEVGFLSEETLCLYRTCPNAGKFFECPPLSEYLPAERKPDA
jgi:hypothetical protein